MGGSVSVRSVLGEGSTFSFAMRLGLAARSANLPERHADLRGLRVLVVDDSPQARTVLQGLLERIGVLVSQAASGAAALQAVAQADQLGEPFDAVLMDWHMPGMDGIQTATQMQSMDLLRRPRIAIVTTHIHSNNVSLAESVSVQEVLSKPCHSSAICDAVLRLNAFEQSLPQGAGFSRRLSSALHGSEALRGARVLLAEDNVVNQQVATDLLAAVGVEVMIVANGEVAVEMARQTVGQSYLDAILMDCRCRCWMVWGPRVPCMNCRAGAARQSWP